jgi:Mrp family chromosome partitioning ATPase
MHLWAAIERHVTQAASRPDVVTELPISAPPFVLGVTSAVLGEGKTTVAMNLAESASRNTWYRVCLLDLGLDGDEISMRHGIESDGTGAIDLLEESAPGKFTSQSLPTYWLEDRAGLTVLPAGKQPSNAARTARSPHLAPLIECLREKFDLIIVDLPAVSTDNALALTAAMDGIVVVARAGATPAEVVGEAVNKIGRESVIGVVLNRVKFAGPSWMKRLLLKW